MKKRGGIFSGRPYSGAMSSPLSKEAFLAKFPWDEQFLAQGRPLEYFWVYEFPFPSAEVWPVITDTSTLNRRLDLPAMKFNEVEGKLLGSASYGGVFTQWEEVPWEWEYRRYLESARIYSKGIAKYVRACDFLEDLDDGGTRLYVFFGWIPRNWWSRILLSIGMGGLGKRYGRTVEKLVREARAEREALTGGASVGAEDAKSAAESAGGAHYGNLADVDRLRSARKVLIEKGLRAELVDRVFQYISTESDENLYRIRVRGLARKWGVDEKELLLLFLHATREGVFYLTWDVICPHCRGVRSELTHLGELPKRDECEVCDIDFDTQGINSFEVTFHIHASVRDVAKRFFCSAEPATKSHIKLQLTLAPGEERDVSTLLDPGIYRMRVQGEKNYSPLELAGEHEQRRIDWASLNREALTKALPQPAVFLRNTDADRRTYIIEANADDLEMLRPVDLFNFQDFRDLFSEEALAADIELDIGEQTILFTDVVGSSRFYQERGDQGAFAQVRKQFVMIYESVRKYEGVVVKTIGDAAMAAFANPADALRCATDLQQHFHPSADRSVLRLRISVHKGSCLAVNLNSNIDYFGNTVNLAAKLQAVVEAGQVVFSGAVLENRAARKYLSEERIPLKKLSYEQPWDGSAVDVYRYEVTGEGFAGSDAA